ncbi:hypothetical protein [Nonomuraea dietziae]
MPDALLYRVYRAEKEAGPYTGIGTTERGPSFDDDGVLDDDPPSTTGSRR